MKKEKSNLETAEVLDVNKGLSGQKKSQQEKRNGWNHLKQHGGVTEKAFCWINMRIVGDKDDRQ